MLQKNPGPPVAEAADIPESAEAMSIPQSASEQDIAAILKDGRRSGRSRRVAVVAVAAVVAAAGLWWWLAAGGDSAVTYTMRPVTRGDLTVTVTATGTVEPTNEVLISSELSGTVRSVAVDYNDRVSQGGVLATLDTDKLTANVALAKATLAARAAEVSQAEATAAETAAAYERTMELANRGVSTTQALETAKAADDRAKAALASARANLEIAEANLSISETDLAKAEIKSPIDGVVLARDVEPGQIVAASLSAPVLFTLAEDLSEMELQVDVDEADMGMVRAGDPATFTVEAYKDQTFPARIAQVRLSPETVEGVVTYKAILTVDNSDLLLRPGMTATADITVETVEDSILVPNGALRYAPPAQQTSDSRGAGLLGLLMPSRPNRPTTPTMDADGRQNIWVLRDGAPVAVAVEVGLSDGTRTAVSGDISEEDAVIVGSRTAG